MVLKRLTFTMQVGSIATIRGAEYSIQEALTSNAMCNELDGYAQSELCKVGSSSSCATVGEL
jgi:hypothetical protein